MPDEKDRPKKFPRMTVLFVLFLLASLLFDKVLAYLSDVPVIGVVFKVLRHLRDFLWT